MKEVIVCKCPMRDLQKLDTYIEENNVPISISVALINAVESLRKLHITHIFTDSRIHQKAHPLTNSFAVVYIVVTVKIEYEWSICKDCRNSNLRRVINIKMLKMCEVIKGSF
jgi:hypothetical protein